MDHHNTQAPDTRAPAPGMRGSGARVLDEIGKILARPHHPSICPAKGMFGRDCANCDRGIPPADPDMLERLFEGLAAEVDAEIAAEDAARTREETP